MECPFSAHKKIRSKRRCFTEFITARSNECMHASEWMNDSATLWWPECLVHWLNQWMTEWMTICIEGVNHRTNNINNKSFLTYYFSEPRLLSASYSLSYLVSEQPLLWALSYLFSKSPRVWATSCLSCFFSDQPLLWLLLLWAISALSKVFSATSSLSNPLCGLFLSWVISSYNYLFLELLILWAKPFLTYSFSELPLLCGTSSLSRVFSEPSFLWATSLSQVVPKPLLLSLIRSPAIYGLQNSVGICDIMCEAHLTLIPQCAVLVHYISFTCDLIWIVSFLAFCTVSFWALEIPVMPTEEITGAMGERECATQVPRFAFRRSGTWTDWQIWDAFGSHGDNSWWPSRSILLPILKALEHAFQKRLGSEKIKGEQEIRSRVWYQRIFAKQIGK